MECRLCLVFAFLFMGLPFVGTSRGAKDGERKKNYHLTSDTPRQKFSSKKVEQISRGVTKMPRFLDILNPVADVARKSLNELYLQLFHLFRRVTREEGRGEERRKKTPNCAPNLFLRLTKDGRHNGEIILM